MPVVSWSPPEIQTVRPKRWSAAFTEHCRWYEKHLRVETREGGVLPFQLYDIQMYLEWLVWQAERAQVPIFIDVLKARREGISTWAAACFFRRGVQHLHRRCLTMSCDQQSTDNIHEMTRFFAQSFREPCSMCNGRAVLKDWREQNGECDKCGITGTMPLLFDKDSASLLQLENSKSRFSHYTAGAKERTGRGHAAQHLHFSEYDFALSEDYYTSVMQVTPNTYPTIVIIESTANGPEGPMNRHWDAAVKGQNGAIPVFFSWFDFQDYTRPVSFEDVLSQPQAGPMERAGQWIEDNKVKIALVKERIETLKEEYDALGNGKSSGLHAGKDSGNGRDPDELRDSGTSDGETEQAEGKEARKAALRAKSSGSIFRAGSGNGRNLPDRIGGSSSRFWKDLGHKYQGHGRDLLDPKRGEWHAHVILSLSDDDWRAKGRTILKTMTPFFEHPVRILGRAAMFGFMVESLSDYERDLIDEFDLKLEQINQLRWFKAKKCRGEEITRRREYPSRPDEAFSYPEESVLDPVTIRQWTELAKQEKTHRVNFRMKDGRYGELEVEALTDPLGSVLLWEEPEEGQEYAMGVDPSSGMAKGDWCVASVLRKDTGLQVGEFRSRMEPHRAIDQIEALGVYFNCAFTGVEINSIGMAFCRALEDRATLPMYERENPRRKEPGQLVKLIGWKTDATTRDMLITEARQAVRENRCRIRSLETLDECRTLIVNRNKITRNERIEARSGCHDDGFFGWGIAGMMRNRMLDEEKEVVDEDVEEKIEYPDFVEELISASERTFHKPRMEFGRQVTVISPGRRSLDGRRNVL